MCNTELQRNMKTANLEAQYDSHAKKLLAHKIVLAWIMHCCVPEYKEIEPQEIANRYIEKTYVGSVGILPGESTELIHGSTTEDTVPNEGKITYDVLFTALAPYRSETIGLIINVEAQNQYNPGYPLESRGIFYCSRMLSAQYGKDFQNADYRKLKKVYSIWICTNPLVRYQNSIATYKITEVLNIGGSPRDPKNYDLMNVIMIGLGSPKRDNYNGILKFLATLLSSEMSLETKQKILEDEFNLQMDHKLKEVTAIMCNLSQGILQTGIEIGKSEGIEIGKSEGIEIFIIDKIDDGIDDSTIVAKLIKRFNLTEKQAIEHIQKTRGKNI